MKNQASAYTIFDVQLSEVHNKAQVIVYAALSQQLVGTQESLEATLAEIYEQYKDTAGFRKFGLPTVVNAYLFTSEGLGRKDKSAHIAWLRKGPNEVEPIIKVDELRLADLRAWDANEWTEDTIAYEQLNRALFDKGLELCSLNNRLKQIEHECTRKADLRYPDFDLEHTTYNDELLSAALSEIKAVHNLDDDLLNSVHVFARAFRR